MAQRNANHPTPRRYVAIIADGNRRWARQRGYPTSLGHEAGTNTLRARILDAIDLGLEQLTVFSFSTENWSRPPHEICALIALFARRIATDTPALHSCGVRMRFLGRRDDLPSHLIERMRWSEALTAHNDRLTLFLAINYGGRAEIVHAARHFQAGGEASFRRHLYDPELRDPEVIIRTGGEQRLSNYLLWQAANAELIFRAELWPDFDRSAFFDSLDIPGPRSRITQRPTTTEPQHRPLRVG